ncbi:hypothetical protein [Caulobacter sp. CCH9-E1]|uniref:hypothetical protein n=1 Tax=Caulobacter sp. CCH9-E1 TaxID=1768768 RepID=UPI00082F1E8A|nr:hypothetical protein [Caulobacter sp. CCH9-E1]
MLLSGLLLAAALQAPPEPTAAPKPQGPPARVAVPFSQAPRMKGQRPAWECRRRATLARKTQDETAKPLNRMPMGLGERAVMRMVDGCPVRTPIIQPPPRR